MREAVHVAGPEDKAPAKLERIRPELTLAVTAGLRPLSSRSVVAAQQMKQVGAQKTRRAVSLALFIHQQRERNSGLFAEESRITPVSQADGRQYRPSFAEGVLAFAQLRDVLAAEDSAVMTEEDEDRRPLRPQGPQAEFAPVGIGQKKGS
jgi:hypothetical protein